MKSKSHIVQVNCKAPEKPVRLQAADEPRDYSSSYVSFCEMVWPPHVEFEFPEDSLNQQCGVQVVNNGLTILFIYTWLELSKAERYAMMSQQGGRVIG